MAIYRTVVECQAYCSGRTIVRGERERERERESVCVSIHGPLGYVVITSTVMFRPGVHREDVPTHRTHHQLRYPGYTDRIPHSH